MSRVCMGISLLPPCPSCPRRGPGRILNPFPQSSPDRGRKVPILPHGRTGSLRLRVAPRPDRPVAAGFAGRRAAAGRGSAPPVPFPPSYPRFARRAPPRRLPGAERHAGGSGPAGGPAIAYRGPLGGALPGVRPAGPLANPLQGPRQARCPERRSFCWTSPGGTTCGWSLPPSRPTAVGLPGPKCAEEPFALLERVGRVPLPPYIRKGEMIESDRQHYQTVYARHPGAVAAPTAGLHFTEALLARLEKRGVATCRLTLHVGAGHVSAHHRRAVGRAQAARRVGHDRAGGRRGRFSPAGNGAGGSWPSAPRRSASWKRPPRTARSSRSPARPICSSARPFRFHAVDALLTNFHLPRTTLLVLVRTFGGDELIRRAYEEAIRQQYRFYSYGDAMLIL